MIKDPVMISARPRVVETRTQVGHWEGDLLVGNRTTAVVTLVEPKTRFLVMAALPANRTAEALNTAVAAQLGRFPKSLRRSLTWDQGKEIAHHKALRERVGIDVYLCDPNSPWQRGTNENTNGLLRQYLRLRANVGFGCAGRCVGHDDAPMMLLFRANRRWWARVVGSEPVLVSGSELVVVVSA